MSKCPHCGAEVQYSPKIHKVHCEYCNSDFSVSELINESKKAKKNKVVEDNSPKLEGVAYTCTQCGATLLTFDETAATFCSYCGSQNMIEEKVYKENAPEYIIPFSKTQEECIKNYKRKISWFFFCPSFMKNDLVIKKIRGIYMPYGMYTLSFHGDCVNKGQKYDHRSGDYVYYNDFDLHAQVDATYEGLSYDLVSKYYDEYSHAIPFNSKEAVPFNVNYLPGFYADTHDVAIGTYSSNVLNFTEKDSTRHLKSKFIYTRYHCSNPKAYFHVEKQSVGFFPVYFLATKNPKEDKLYYAVINGQTGKVAADLPIAFHKYIIVSILLAFPIYYLLMGAPVVLPFVINWFSIFAAVVAWIIYGIQISKCNDRDNRINDRGYTSVIPPITYTDKNGKKRTVKNHYVKKYKMTLGALLKFVGAITISLLTLIWSPVQDYFYYIASMISLTLILLSFYDLVKIHNILVSRPIPQLEKRGGDESE